MTKLVWLQRELRTQDHPALSAALDQAQRHNTSVIVAYFHDPEHTLGRANSVWLAHALSDLQHTLQQKGGALWLIEGAFTSQLDVLIRQYAITEVFYTYQPGEPFAQLQQQAQRVCQQTQTALTPFETENILPYARLLNQTQQPYKVFTPFFKALQARLHEIEPLPTPPTTHFAQCLSAPKAFQTLPSTLKTLMEAPWAQSLIQAWSVGEDAAWAQWHRFQTHRIEHYNEQRDFPNIEGTSRLSPALHFGHLHPRALLQQQRAHTDFTALSNAQQTWFSQLAWREFARSILWHFPQSQTTPFQPKFQGFYQRLSQQSEAAHQHYQAWCHGQTGVPIIDAGMRQLWHTGWMHNRVRMITASWLTKNADIHWLDGAAWFADTLFDADPANNTMGWQWVAGSGVDASPYYRLFNPLRQSERFDPQGDYIAQWVPELASLPPKQRLWPHPDTPKRQDLFATAKAPDYPAPKIDLKASRQRHLEKVEQLKQRGRS